MSFNSDKARQNTETAEQQKQTEKEQTINTIVTTIDALMTAAYEQGKYYRKDPDGILIIVHVSKKHMPLTNYGWEDIKPEVATRLEKLYIYPKSGWKSLSLNFNTAPNNHVETSITLLYAPK